MSRVALHQTMIGSVRHKALRKLFDEGISKGLSPDLVPRLRRMLSALHAADDLKSLETISGWRLHALKGDMLGTWSLSVSGNWRLIFKWQDGVAEELDLVDYH
jgi:toxin HigB-1